MRSVISFALASAASLTLFAATPVSAGAGRISPEGRPLGQSAVEWQRLYIDWLATSATNPLFTGSCGEVVEGAYFLPPSTGPDVRLECDVPLGVPVVVAPSGVFSEIPTYGADDAAVLADARSTYAQLLSSSVTIDGVAVSLDGVVREAGVYDIGPVETGSFYDVLCAELTPPCIVDFEPGDIVRLASVGEILVLHPFTPGTHIVVLFDEFTFSGPVMLTATLHVGK
jgi:hypothetical protein